MTEMKFLHKRYFTVKQQNKIGVMKIFYRPTVDVLTVYRTYLPKIINVALNLPKLL